MNNSNINPDENLENLSIFSEQLIITFGYFMEDNQEVNFTKSNNNNSPLLYNINQPEELNSETNNVFPFFSILDGLAENETIKKDSSDKLSTKDNCINDNKIRLELELEQAYISKKKLNIKYRKDAYYKYFKANLGRYIKNKINVFKNKCFPLYFRNNFSSPNYRYTGNPKEKDNFIFLTFTIKALLIFGKNKVKFNRQYNNELIINFIEKNESKAKDRNAYKELIIFLNETLEDAIIQFYDDENEFNKMKNDSKFFHFDEFYKRETGISLLEKYGFLKALKK